MKKSIIIMLLTVFVFGLSFTNYVSADQNVPKQVDSYTQVYDKGDGNYRMILQTNTQKGQVPQEAIIDDEFVIADVKLNPLINITGHEAHHTKAPGVVSSNYDADNNVINWTMLISDEPDTDPDFDWDNWEPGVDPFPVPHWPKNYLVVDFTIDDEVYGDILVFESVGYTAGYEGADNPYKHTFKFWQNAVRVEAPAEALGINIDLYEDSDLTKSAQSLSNENDDFYAKITITNSNDQKLKNVAFSSNLDLYDLVVKDDNGNIIVPSIEKLDKESILNLDFEGNKPLFLTARLSDNGPFFSGDDLEVIAKATTDVFNIYQLDMSDENILGSGSYVVLKTEDQMSDPTLEVPFAKDEGYGWTEDTPEDTPYKTSFEYDLTLPQSLVEQEGLTSQDSEIISLAADSVDPKDPVDSADPTDTVKPTETVPKTGDESYALLYGSILLLAGLLLTVLIRKRKEI